MSITTVTLKTAQMLRESGFPQNSDFIWHEFDYGDNSNHWPGHIKPANEFRLEFHKRPLGRYENDVYQGKEFWCSAPCLDELLNELPKYIEENNKRYYLRIGICDQTNDFHISYVHGENEDEQYLGRWHDDKSYHGNIYAKELAEALAQTWLWLNKEGLIK